MCTDDYVKKKEKFKKKLEGLQDDHCKKFYEVIVNALDSGYIDEFYRFVHPKDQTPEIKQKIRAEWLSKLVLILDDSDDYHFNHVLGKTYHQATILLSKVTHIFPEYTLHDKTHIDNMLKFLIILIPPDFLPELNLIEVSLIFLSIILHDIGMTCIKSNDRQFNFDKNSEECRRFVRSLKLTIEKFNKIDDVKFKRSKYSDYVRQNHAKRGAKYIMNEYKNYHHSIIGGILNEIHFSPDNDRNKYIIMLCALIESHCIDIKDLFDFFMKYNDSFEKSSINIFENGDFKNTEIDNNIINIAYIAVILRLTDIFDYGQDRTPRILYDHFKIRDSISRKEWDVHQQDIRFDFNSNKQIRCHVNCTHPVFEKSIRLHLENIDYEISGSIKNILQNEKLKNEIINERGNEIFRAGDDRFVENQDEKMFRGIRFKINGNCKSEENFLTITKEISRDWIHSEGYVYFDTAFTINEDKIKKYFMSYQLYENEFIFIRELLQNSLDAINHLKSTRPIVGFSDDFNYESFCNGLQIKVGTEKIGEHQCLYIFDNGIGMSEDIIKKFFSKLGDSYYTSEDFDNYRWKIRYDLKNEYSKYLDVNIKDEIASAYINQKELNFLNLDDKNKNIQQLIIKLINNKEWENCWDDNEMRIVEKLWAVNKTRIIEDLLDKFNRLSPVSFFGLGIYSCFMVANKIEIFTRHYDKRNNDNKWIHMEVLGPSSLFCIREKCNTNPIKDRFGKNYGTYLRVYMKKKYRLVNLKNILKKYLYKKNVYDLNYLNNIYCSLLSNYNCSAKNNYSNAIIHDFNEYFFKNSSNENNFTNFIFEHCEVQKETSLIFYDYITLAYIKFSGINIKIDGERIDCTNEKVDIDFLHTLYFLNSQDGIALDSTKELKQDDFKRINFNCDIQISPESPKDRMHAILYIKKPSEYNLTIMNNYIIPSQIFLLKNSLFVCPAEELYEIYKSTINVINIKKNAVLVVNFFGDTLPLPSISRSRIVFTKENKDLLKRIKNILEEEFFTNLLSQYVDFIIKEILSSTSLMNKYRLLSIYVDILPNCFYELIKKIKEIKEMDKEKIINMIDKEMDKEKIMDMIEPNRILELPVKIDLNEKPNNQNITSMNERYSQVIKLTFNKLLKTKVTQMDEVYLFDSNKSYGHVKSIVFSEKYDYRMMNYNFSLSETISINAEDEITITLSNTKAERKSEIVQKYIFYANFSKSIEEADIIACIPYLLNKNQLNSNPSLNTQNSMTGLYEIVQYIVTYINNYFALYSHFEEMYFKYSFYKNNLVLPTEYYEKYTSIFKQEQGLLIYFPYLNLYEGVSLDSNIVKNYSDDYFSVILFDAYPYIYFSPTKSPKNEIYENAKKESELIKQRHQN